MKIQSCIGTAFLLLSVVANAATVGSNIQAEIVAGTVITHTGTALQLGNFTVTVAGGTLSISPEGVRGATGSVVLVSGVTATAASFDVTGAPGSTYSVSLPADGTVTVTGPGDPMVLNFVSSPPASGTFGGSGVQTLFVGATLTIPANQPAGHYSGSFDTNIQYN